MSYHRSVLALWLTIGAATVLDAQPPSGLPEGARLRLGTSGVGKGEAVAATTLSLGGKLVAVAGRDAITLAKRDSSKPLAVLEAPIAMAIAFSRDGKLFAYGNRQNIVVAEMPSGMTVHTLEVPEGPLANPLGLSISANGKVLAVGERAASNKTKPHAHVWNLDSGKHMGTYAVAQSRNCRTALSADGKRLATWGQHQAYMIGEDDEAGKVVQLWDLAAGKEARSLKIDRPNAMIHAAAFAPDGKTIVVACGMSFFHLFDVETGRELRRFAGRYGLTTALQFSPDGKWLLAGSKDGTVQGWHVADGKRLSLPPGPLCEVEAFGFGAHDQIVAIGHTRQSVFCWDARAGMAGHASGHQGAVQAVTFAPNGRSLTSAAADGSAIEWDANTGKPLRRAGIMDDMLRRGGDPSMRLRTLALSPDGRYAATNVIYPNTVRLWDLGRGLPACDFETTQPSGSFGVAFTPKGDRLATAGLMKQINLWNVETGEEVASLAYDKAGNVMGRGVPRMTFSPDGKTLAIGLSTVDGMTGQPFGRVLLLDVATGKERLSLEAPPTDPQNAATPVVSFAPDSKIVALPGPGGSVVLAHADSGKQWKRLETSGGFTALSALAFSPDARTLAIAHGGQRAVGPMGESTMTLATIEVWELASGGRRALYRGHNGAVNCLGFAPDGLTLASGSADTTVILWDAAGRAGKPVAALDAEWAKLAKADAAVAFRVQGRLLATPEQTIAFVAKQLRPAQPAAVDPKQIAASVAKLDSEDFSIRDDAFRTLQKLGAVAEAALQKGRTDKISLEMRRRIDDLLDKIARGNLTPAELQAMRAVEVLERIGTPPARALLQTLARGAETAVLTKEARKALARLKGP